MDSTQTLTAVITAVLVIAVLAMIWFGWRSRLRRQAGVERLPQVPGELTPASLVADGQYVATTTAGDWLDRIAVQGLGIRTTAELSVHAEGILFDRAGVAPVFIPREALVEAGPTGTRHRLPVHAQRRQTALAPSHPGIDLRSPPGRCR